MDCRRVKKSLLEYSEGGLSAKRRSSISQHLQACDDCARLAEKLALSASAIDLLQPLRMDDSATGRVLGYVKERGVAPKTAGGGLFRSTRALVGAGAVTAILVALAVVVGIITGGEQSTEDRASGPSAPTQAAGIVDTAPSTPAEEESLLVDSALPLPVAAVTANNYDEESMRTMAEKLEVNKEFAESFSLSDAINLRIAFIRKLADEFVDVGGDGAMLEAMISFVQTTEPVMLPCYVEKAFFTDREVYILAFSGPPRGGASKKLTRTEFWAFDPVRFPENPDASLIWWGQSSD